MVLMCLHFLLYVLSQWRRLYLLHSRALYKNLGRFQFILKQGHCFLDGGLHGAPLLCLTLFLPPLCSTLSLLPFATSLSPLPFYLHSLFCLPSTIPLGGEKFSILIFQGWIHWLRGSFLRSQTPHFAILILFEILDKYNIFDFSLTSRPRTI